MAGCEAEEHESVLQETRSLPPPRASREAVESQRLAALHRRAAEDHVGFWAEQARENIRWHKPFSITLDDAAAPNYHWFPDGELNVSYNCLDVHMASRGDKPAIVFEGERGDQRRLSYRDLHAEVCRLANGLRSLGIGRGDQWSSVADGSEAVIAIQACARIGAVHWWCSAGWRARCASHRDAGARLVT
jgi:acetyl-CoA synthetase